MIAAWILGRHRPTPVKLDVWTPALNGDIVTPREGLVWESDPPDIITGCSVTAAGLVRVVKVDAS